MRNAHVFWQKVVEDAYNGAIPGGVEPLVVEALRMYPANAELREYLDRLTAVRRHVPSVLISYPSEHAVQVRAFADRLESDGLDVRLDLYVSSPAEGWPEWTRRQASTVDFIVLVCTAEYRSRFEDEGASTSESLLAQYLFYGHHDRKQGLLPVLLPGSTELDIPRALRSYTAYDLPDDYDRLLRRMTEISKPWP